MPGVAFNRWRRVGLALGFAWVGAVVAWLSTRDGVRVDRLSVTKSAGMSGRLLIHSDGSIVAASLREVVHRGADGRRFWSASLGWEFGVGGQYTDVAELSDGSILTAYATVAGSRYLVWLTNGVVARRKEMDLAITPMAGGFAAVTSNAMAVPTGEGLVVLNHDGSERWTYPTASAMYHCPAVAPDGGYLFEVGGGATNTMIRLQADGTLRWERRSEAGYGDSAVFRGDGSFLWGRGPGLTLAAFDAEGQPLWQLSRPESATCVPAFGAGEVAYVGVRQNQRRARLLAVERDGSVRWEAELREALILHPPVVSPGGDLYAVTMDRWVWAFDGQGKAKWKYRVPWRLDRYLPRGAGELQAWWQQRMGYARPAGYGPPQLDASGRLWVNFGHLGSVFRFETRP